MQTLLTKHGMQKDRDVERYRAARKALVVLDPTGSWQQTLLPLLHQDIHPPIRGQAASTTVSNKRKSRNGLESEGRRSLSWIWRSMPQFDSATDVTNKQELEDGEF